MARVKIRVDAEDGTSTTVEIERPLPADTSAETLLDAAVAKTRAALHTASSGPPCPAGLARRQRAEA